MSSDRTPPEVPAVDGLRRWREIVERRRVQMESAYDRAGQANVDYWGRRARAYRAALHQRTDEDPFLLRVLRDVGLESTVLDVGAGTGRHTLELAPRVARVTAVDPSEAMLGMLRQDLAERKLTNVEILQSEWQSARVDQADIVVCSHVLYPIADVEPFVRKLAASAKQRVFVYLRADPLPTDLGLWAEFHGEALQGQPVHMDLLLALASMDIYPDVDIVHHRFTYTFESLEEAVTQLRHGVCLRDDDAAATEKLRALLKERLVPWPDGRLGPAVESARSAIISWAPGG